AALPRDAAGVKDTASRERLLEDEIGKEARRDVVVRELVLGQRLGDEGARRIAEAAKRRVEREGAFRTGMARGIGALALEDRLDVAIEDVAIERRNLLDPRGDRATEEQQQCVPHGSAPRSIQRTIASRSLGASGGSCGHAERSALSIAC